MELENIQVYIPHRVSRKIVLLYISGILIDTTSFYRNQIEKFYCESEL